MNKTLAEAKKNLQKKSNPLDHQRPFSKKSAIIAFNTTMPTNNWTLLPCQSDQEDHQNEPYINKSFQDDCNKSSLPKSLNIILFTTINQHLAERQTATKKFSIGNNLQWYKAQQQ